jgi:hypothetical protein
MPAAEFYDSGGGTKQKSVAPSTLTSPDTLAKLWQSTGSPATFGVCRITMSSGTLTHGPSIHWRLPLITLGRPKRAHQSLPRLSASVVWQSNTEQQLVCAGQRTCGRRRLSYQGSSSGLLQSRPNAWPLKRAAHGGIESARTATNSRTGIVVIFIEQVHNAWRLRSKFVVTRPSSVAEASACHRLRKQFQEVVRRERAGILRNVDLSTARQRPFFGRMRGPNAPDRLT